MKRTALFTSSLLLIDLAACVLPDKLIGDGDDDFGSDDVSTTDDGSQDDMASEPETADEMATEPETGDEGPFDECAGPFPDPSYDHDCDGFGICDNAPSHLNPDQLNQDDDIWGDVRDLCPLLTGFNNDQDADKDGIGNACDLCSKDPEVYNAEWTLGVDTRMHVRNIPSYVDTDMDGIGDVCDNCPTVPNCSIYGTDMPAPFGIEAHNLPFCQLDEDQDGIGDECEAELPPPDTAGPIGFADADDFDQDGITNAEDHCPRLSLAGHQPCTSDVDCEELGDGFTCASTPTIEGIRICNHRDTDSDQVGDECDTCSTTPNPLQVDEDGDFIGAACEADVGCSTVTEPRPLGYYDMVVNGYCCVTTWPGDDMLHDPDGKPIRLNCTSEQEEAGICRRLPASVAAMPGVVELPPGCEDALAEAGLDEAPPLTLDDFDGDPGLLSNYACMLPPWDQDFDGLGDACDMCPWGFDPTNQPWVDDMGTLWETTGKFCAGDYDYTLVPGAACEWP